MEISEILEAWYAQYGRELPWRATKDPYRIWISEIILQQTRVTQGLAYYNRFVGRFADVHALAEAHEDEVLKYWQGLGYYSRARNLHAAAKEVCERYGGVFPTTYPEVKSLKGVGDYTAAAICSIAYGQPYAVVDGNVYRVLARLFDVDTPIDSSPGKKQFAELAQSLLDTAHPEQYNQAIMDFGALQCLPKSPNCSVCPFEGCLARARGRVELLPVKKGKTRVTARYFNYFHILCKGDTLLAKRTSKDIWQNLYEFPLIETSEPMEWESLQNDSRFVQLFEGVEQLSLKEQVTLPKHQLSHRTIYARFYRVEVEALSPGMEAFLRTTPQQFHAYAISRLTEIYLQRL